MSVYKEAMHWTAMIDEKQVQLYNDACDYAVPVTDEQNSEELQLVKNLKELYGRTAERKVRKNALGETVTLELTFLDEFGDGSEVPCKITYQRFSTPQKVDAVDEKIVGALEITCDKWLSRYGTLTK